MTDFKIIDMEKIELCSGDLIWSGRLPNWLVTNDMEFNQLWDLHPEEYHQIMLHGNSTLTPRWQQAFARNYYYTGQVNYALAMPDLLKPYMEWSQENIDPQLNGMLINWYDGSLGHYIGRHRDSIRGLVPDSPIVTLSLGEDRVFRLRPWSKDRKSQIKPGYFDLQITNGSVLIMPWNTNLHWTHEVPRFTRHNGLRISVTLRAFSGSEDQHGTDL